MILMKKKKKKKPLMTGIRNLKVKYLVQLH